MADSYLQYNSHADGLDCVNTILDKAEATTSTYPLKRITRNFNAASDLYYGWAFEADGRWSYDDVNETSPPIDTQNIVSGTNRYKVGTFTEKVIRLIRLEVLNADGNGVILEPEYFNELSETFQERYVDPVSGTPTHYCKYGDFIYLTPKPDYSETGGLIAYFNRPMTYMASTNTTTVVGIPLIHIALVCEIAANMFRHDTNRISLNEKIAYENYVKGIVTDYFSQRDEEAKDVFKPRITPHR